MIKYKNKYRVNIGNNLPGLIFRAPNKYAARIHAEMCGFKVFSVKVEKD
jgi:hypothetical protein